MDPDVTLAAILELMDKLIKEYQASEDGAVNSGDAVALASHIESLDQWLRKGGFLPKEWRHEGR